MVCCFSFIIYTDRIIDRYDFLQVFHNDEYKAFKKIEKEFYLKHIREKIAEMDLTSREQLPENLRGFRGIENLDIDQFISDDILSSLYASPKFMLDILFKGSSNNEITPMKYGNFLKVKYVSEEKDTEVRLNIAMIIQKIEISTWTILLVSGTTFIPSFFYMGLLLIMFTAKIILDVSRFITMHILEVVTEDPKNIMPGTLLGILFSVIAAFAKLIVDFIKFYYGS